LTSIKDETVKLSMIATRLARSTSPARTEIKSWQSCCLDCENGGAGIGLSLYFSLPWTNESRDNRAKAQHAKEAQVSLIATDIMTTKVITAGPDDTVAKIAGLLCDHGISAVPICDTQGGVLGMLSEGDLMRPFGKEKASKRAWWLSLLAEGTDLAPTFLESFKVENHPARELMVTPVITARPMPACLNWPICLRATTSSVCLSCETASSSESSAGRTSCAPSPERRTRSRKQSDLLGGPAIVARR
jgi:CBS domain-containing protein